MENSPAVPRLFIRFTAMNCINTYGINGLRLHIKKLIQYNMISEKEHWGRKIFRIIVLRHTTKQIDVAWVMSAIECQPFERRLRGNPRKSGIDWIRKDINMFKVTNSEERMIGSQWQWLSLVFIRYFKRKRYEKKYWNFWLKIIWNF